MRKLITVTAALALACAVSSNAYALTINTPGVVGAANGTAGDNPGSDAIIIAQALLDLVGTNLNTTCAGGRTCFNGNVDYASETLVKIAKTDVPNDGSDPIVIPAGYKYAIAKYDGQQAGWVLFYLPTFGNSLPAYSYSIWGNNPGQFRISSYTLFNTTDFPDVPDGGSAAALLGSALLGLSLLRRRFNR